ncbi:MAG TPA: ribosome maturation factor RimM [Acidimicrobiia bacterium]
MSDARRLEVGRIGRAHGLRGEVAVTFSTDREERTAAGAVLVAIDDRGVERALVVAAARPHQGRWLVRFEGIGDRTAAEALRGCALVADELPGRGDELWVHELVGAEVVDAAGAVLGRVTAVEANPAHDLLVLESGALVPVTFVVRSDIDRVVVDLPEGLLEL